MFRVLVEESDGTPIGGGPLTSAVRASVTQSIDRAGNVSLEMAATDADAALFTSGEGVYVRIREFRAGEWVTAGRGIVTSTTLDSSGRILQLSGPSIEHELTYTHVGTLTLTDPGTPEDPMAAADVLPAIMDYALPGWTTSGTPSGDVYYQFGDETVLAALIKVAELLGDHFRFDVENREVVWLPTTAAGFDADASGVRAVDKGEPDLLGDAPELAILDGGLQVVTDDTERITRLYPRGSGNAAARLYLNATTLGTGNPGTGVDGDYVYGDYTIHIDEDRPDLSYIKHTVHDAAGRIDGVETFRDIAPLDDSSAAETAAANQLVITAHTALMRRQEPQKAYRLSLVKLDMDLPVGETIRVRVRHVTDGETWIDEDENAMVLDKRSQYEAGGSVRHDVGVTL